MVLGYIFEQQLLEKLQNRKDALLLLGRNILQAMLAPILVSF